ncbi:MAG: penicillin-binding protein 2, partial [Paramuribaculum sp.]|nr:penicillin-binding protein 2 [Paramuribaculum sp.]
MRKDYNLEKRKYVIGALLCLLVGIYIFRLFNLQVVDSKYKDDADSNAFMRKSIYPSRGIIYDRNDNVVVFNRPAYDVMLIPRDVQEFDTLDFCSTIGLTTQQLRQRFHDMQDRRLNPGYSKYTPQTLLTHLTAADYGKLQEKLYRFPGFYIQQRILREYNYDCAANVLGNIREVSPDDIKRDNYYSRGDYTGDLGVEKSYERYLRGEKGEEILIRDANGQIQGRYMDGAHDKKAVSGRNIKLSIDMELQKYAEQLMRNKIGAVVAIEPQTGEVLAMGTSPSYDPSLLVGRDRGKNYKMLREN